jgi:hypothetical protein
MCFSNTNFNDGFHRLLSELFSWFYYLSAADGISNRGDLFSQPWFRLVCHDKFHNLYDDLCKDSLRIIRSCPRDEARVKQAVSEGLLGFLNAYRSDFPELGIENQGRAKIQTAQQMPDRKSKPNATLVFTVKTQLEPGDHRGHVHVVLRAEAGDEEEIDPTVGVKVGFQYPEEEQQVTVRILPRGGGDIGGVELEFGFVDRVAVTLLAR